MLLGNQIPQAKRNRPTQTWNRGRCVVLDGDELGARRIPIGRP